jgi:Ca2+-binding RTX toxin-like protein
MRRRAVLSLATMVLGVFLASGVALAKTIEGTDKPNDLIGSDRDDMISGRAGADYVSGGKGSDVLYGGPGNDTVVGRTGSDRISGDLGSDRLFGNFHNDRITAGDGQEDVLYCGSGVDTTYVDKIDIVSDDCENVFVAVRTAKPGA